LVFSGSRARSDARSLFVIVVKGEFGDGDGWDGDKDAEGPEEGAAGEEGENDHDGGKFDGASKNDRPDDLINPKAQTKAEEAEADKIPQRSTFSHLRGAEKSHGNGRADDGNNFQDASEEGDGEGEGQMKDGAGANPGGKGGKDDKNKNTAKVALQQRVGGFHNAGEAGAVLGRGEFERGAGEIGALREQIEKQDEE